MNKIQKKNAVSGKSESTVQRGINPGQPCSPPYPHAKLEDVFALKSPEYPLEQHESNALLPPMLPHQLQRLTEDIRKNGLKVPVVLCEGKVLDGWQRYQICRQLNIEPRFEQSTGKHPLLELWSLNIARRNLGKCQLAVLADKIINRMVEEFKQDKELERSSESDQGEGDNSVTPIQATDVENPEGTQKKRTKRKRGKTRSYVCKLLGVSAGYAQKAKNLRETALDLYEEVGAGKLTLSEAKREVYRRRQTEAKNTDSVVIDPTERRFKLYNCDILAAPIEDGSLDAIITDPQYTGESLDCWTKLAEFASRKLKNGGVLLAMGGTYHLPELIRNLTVKGLRYHWVICNHMPGNGPLAMNKQLRSNWKPVLWYTKGNYTGTFQATDVLTSDYKDSAEGKRYHEWGQSVPFFTQLVERFTSANDFVCDPFLGGGTTGIACLSLKRRFVGVDIDPVAYATSHKRLSEWKPEPITVELFPQSETESLAA